LKSGGSGYGEGEEKGSRFGLKIKPKKVKEIERRQSKGFNE